MVATIDGFDNHTNYDVVGTFFFSQIKKYVVDNSYNVVDIVEFVDIVDIVDTVDIVDIIDK